MTDTELVNQIKKGSEDAFKALVDNFQAMVFNVILGILQNFQDAEDATQETFVEVYKSIHQYKFDSKLSTWLYRIASNKALATLRRKNSQKRNAKLLSIFGLGQGFNEPGHFNHPGVELENKELAQILFAAIDKLPEKQKIAYILHKLEGVSQQEIADIMGQTVGGVESILVRAKSQLRILLKKYYEKF